MTHPEELLADLVAGTLSEADRTVLDAHLATCTRCSAEVAAASAARSALRALPDVPVPSGLADRLARAATPSLARPSRYRWLGVAAAAAVIALALVNLPRGGSPAATEATAGLAPGGGAASTKMTDPPQLYLLVQPTNYNQLRVDELTNSTLQQAGAAASAPSGAPQEISPIPGERIGTSAETQTALACVGKAVPSDAGVPFKLILARFDEKEAFLAFYQRSPHPEEPPTGLVVWIVDGHTCTATGVSSTRI